MYFDTHAHYDDEQFDHDRQTLLNNIHESGVELVVDPGCDIETSKKAISIAQQFNFVYAAVGFHPHEASSFEEGSIDELTQLLSMPKVVAIGEIGLDFHFDFSPRDIQRKVFIAQMELAERQKKPVIVHDREAHGECLEIVKSFPNVTGVFHCYAGSAEMAQQLVSMGWSLSFTGAITFKNARRAIETIEVVSLDRIMIETDSPYLAPVPNRGKRNDSSNLPYVVDVIAKIKNLEPEEVARITLENGKRFFNIR